MHESEDVDLRAVEHDVAIDRRSAVSHDDANASNDLDDGHSNMPSILTSVDNEPPLSDDARSKASSGSCSSPVDATTATDSPHTAQKDLGEDVQEPEIVLPPIVITFPTPTTANANVLSTEDVMAATVAGFPEADLLVATPALKQRSIRFRPRVRIGSGLGKRPQAGSSVAARRQPSQSSTTSESSSISSSVSAPLRLAGEEGSLRRLPGWGTLGQRVRLLANGSRRRSYGHVDERGHGPGKRERSLYPRVSDEHTPLMASHNPTRYGVTRRDHGPDDDEQARLSHEIDVVFGKWPGRLLNRHWWWWQVEPVVCCYCICPDESDYEVDD